MTPTDNTPKTTALGGSHATDSTSHPKTKAAMKKIILIDDDPLFSLMLRKKFEHTGLVSDVRCFEKGQDALIYLIDHFDQPDQLPDLVFVDLNMPLWDGWEFLRTINSLSLQFSKKTRFFILSAFFQPNDIERAVEFKGIEGFIEKPSSLGDIQRFVAGFVA